jgi:hypothetical protein
MSYLLNTTFLTTPLSVHEAARYCAADRKLSKLWDREFSAGKALEIVSLANRHCLSKFPQDCRSGSLHYMKWIAAAFLKALLNEYDVHNQHFVESLATGEGLYIPNKHCTRMRAFDEFPWADPDDENSAPCSPCCGEAQELEGDQPSA